MPSFPRIQFYVWLVLAAGFALVPGKWGEAGAASWSVNSHQLESISVELGIAGHFKLGSWTEVRIAVNPNAFANTPQVSVTVSDSDGVPTQVEAPEPQRQANLLVWRVPIKIGRRDSDVEVAFSTQQGGRTTTSVYTVAVTQLAVPILATNRWLVQIGPEFGLTEALQRYASQLSENTVLVSLNDIHQLPTRWYLLEGIDQIFWVANDPEQAASIAPPQLDAIQQWIELGGRMVMSVGDEASQLIAPERPLARFAPGQFQEVVTLRDTAELEAMAGGVARVDRPVGGPLQVASVLDIRGEIRLAEGSRQAIYPLWTRSAHGFGIVEFFTFDLSADPIAQWPGRDSLLRLLLEAISDRQQESRVSQQAGQSAAHLGYSDISGHLRMALDQFPGVRSVSFFLIGAIIILYLVLVGPGDYFLLRKLGLRMEWTWVTFPTLILLTSIGIWGLARWSKGTSVKLNQVEVVDIDLESRTVRSTSWFHLFSPGSRRYDLTLEPMAVPTESWNQLLSWQGLAGSGLGGMSARRSISTVPTPYAIDFDGESSPTRTRLSQLPIQVWTSKSLMARGWGSLEVAQYEPLIEGDSQLIEGPLHNPTDLTLFDCYVFHGRWAYYVDQLPPRSSIKRIVPGQSAQNTEKVLKRRRVQDSADGGELWDRQTTDVGRIMEVAMFHNAAGGRSYTHLSHQFQSYIDLSSHITGNRAVLVGKIRQPVSQVEINGQSVPESDSQTWSYVRIVYPVQPRTSLELTQR